MITHNRIKALQREYGFEGIQAMINSGDAWRLEGSLGRHAGQLLDSGVCMLPKKSQRDYYGNHVPSRDEVKAGANGSYANCRDFWSNPENIMNLECV